MSVNAIAGLVNGLAITVLVALVSLCIVLAILR